MEHFAVADIAEQEPVFRKVLWTGEHSQLVVMTLPPGGEIGAEVHEENDQILSFLSGTGTATVAGEQRPVGPGDVVVVPAGTEHNFVADAGAPLVLTTVYGPADHADGVVHRTKDEAEAAEAAGQDEPPA